MSNGRYRKYPEYKDSGTQWQGRIPKHWQLSPLKYLAKFSGGGTPNKDTAAFWNGDIPWVSPKDMKGTFVDRTIDNVTARAVQQSSTNLLAQGALLIVVRSGILQHSIPTAINRVAVTLNQDMKALRFGSEMTAEFAQYFIVGNQKPLLLEWCKQGATVESIEQELLAGSRIPIPPLPEQTQIAKFLDVETAKIDRLIKKQEELIQLLKEKRQAVISHAVTKGLNPHAPLKDSGIEWLGQVPAHWTVGRYKFCTSRVVVGIAEAATHAYAETGTPIIRSTNITEEGLCEDGILYIKSWFAEQNASKYLYTGDVVTVRTGYPGISATVPQLLNRSQCFTNLVATPSKDADSEFLANFLNSHFGKEYFDLTGWGSAQKNISVPILQNIPICWPPLDEQREVVAFVQKLRKKYSALISSAESTITLLQERRTALVSAAVTGKIDVRLWKPPEIGSSLPISKPPCSAAYIQ